MAVTNHCIDNARLPDILFSMFSISSIVGVLIIIIIIIIDLLKRTIH